MSELIDFPFLNQLDDWDTTDGRPSDDKWFLCVPTSIAAGIQYLIGKHLSPDTMKDEAYGEDWVNEGTAASAFVGIADRNGVKLYARQGDCVSIAHEELAKGHPVVFTQQDDHAPEHPDWTHVCVWYKDGPDWLSAMDPFGGEELQYNDAEWRQRMRANEVWILARKEGGQGDDMAIDINTQFVKDYFIERSTTQWHCKTTNQDIYSGILTFYKHNNGLMLFGLPITNEQRVQGVTYQVFERAIIVYDPGHKFDHPPGAGDCYTAHINTGLAQQLISEALTQSLQGDNMTIDINTQFVKDYFIERSPTQWTCKTTNHDIHSGILAFYKHNNGLMLFGLPITDEISQPGIAYQVFERAIIVYDPTHKLDHPPGAEACYTAHIDTGLGQQLLSQITMTR